MNADVLIRGVLQSVLGGRRKRSRRAMRYLTGRQGSILSNPQALLTAAGIAWGLYETWQAKQASTSSSPAGSGSGTPGSSPAVPIEASLPPLPAVGATRVDTDIDDATRIVRLAVAAAHADGSLSDAERDMVLQHAAAAGVKAIVDSELAERRPLAEIVAGIRDLPRASTLYVLAFTVMRADEQVSGADRIFLAQLAHLLGLDPVTVTQLEDQAARRIDAEDDAPSGAPGP